MICKSCNFENREGAVFCAECGKPLKEESASDMKPMENAEDKTVIIDTVVAESKDSVEQKEDDSEANTTVLTSNMVNNQVKPQGAAPVKPMAPMGPGVVGPQMGAPTGQPVNPQQAPQMKPQGVPMGQPGNPQQAPQMKPQGAPMGQPGNPQQAPQMGAPMGQQAPQMKPQGMPVSQPAPAKADKKDKKQNKKNKKEKSGKMGTGTKVYIVISILLILGLAGVGVWGYFHYEDKLEKAETDKATVVADYEAQIVDKDSQITDLNASLTDAQTQVTTLETQVADYEISLAEAQASASAYAAYDGLIQFADSCDGTTSQELFASDSVLHLKTGDSTQVQIYFGSDAGEVQFLCADKYVAECAFAEDTLTGNVVALNVTATGAGATTITLSNDQNETTHVIYVYVD